MVRSNFRLKLETREKRPSDEVITSSQAAKRKKSELRPTVSEHQTRDFFEAIPMDCHDLMLQHVRRSHLLRLSTVSKLWYECIGSSSYMMKKIAFNYDDEINDATGELSVVARKYQHVKVKQEYQNHDINFLKNLAAIMPSVRSLSFEGVFNEECVEIFFAELQNMELKLKHLTFIGEVTNMKLILKRFSQIRELKLIARLESITITDINSQTFASIFKYIRAKTLIIKNVTLMKLTRNDFIYQKEIEELELIMTKIDKDSLKLLIELCFNIKELKLNGVNNDLRDYGDREVVGESSIEQFWLGPQLQPSVLDLCLRVPDNIHDLVFQHLQEDDFTSLSTVSKTWFNLTKSNIEQLTRYRLTPSGIPLRSYQNVYVEIKSGRSINRLITFAPNLSELTLEVLPENFNNVRNLFLMCSFPKLTYLHIVSHESSHLENFKVPKTLIKLILSNFKWTSQSARDTTFFKSLCQAEQLTELHFLETIGLNNFFLTDVSSSFSFQLESLTLPIYKVPLVNVNEFLKTQKDSLAYLSLVTIDFETLRLLTESFQLISFKFLKIRGYLNAVRDIKCKMDSLTALQIPMMNKGNQLKALGPYLELAPNLQQLHIRKLTVKLIEYLREKFPHLKEVHYVKGLEKGSEAIENQFKDLQFIQHDLPFDQYDQYIDHLADERRNRS